MTIILKSISNAAVLVTLMLYVPVIVSQCPQDFFTTIPEDTAIGYEIYTSNNVLAITDTTYAIVRNNQSTSQYRVLLNRTLDAEKETDIRINIACNSLNYRLSIAISDVNESPPVFTLPTERIFKISELSPKGSQITTLKAVDPDIARYRIGYIIQDNYNHFEIVDNDLVISKSIDYETENNSYNVIVTATESTTEPRNSSITLTVNIFDEDDLPPRFNLSIYRLNIPEGRHTNTLKNTTPPIFARDMDVHIDTEVGYKIIAGGRGIFQINNKGEITINGVLDRIQNPSLDFSIRAYQLDNEDMYNDATVLVTLQDVNDHFPQMVNSTYSAEVSESILGGSVILQVSATDDDIGNNRRFLFYVNGTEYFEVSTLDDTGTIRLRRDKILDRETMSKHRFHVFAREINEPSHESNWSQVTVVVKDVNDNRPVFVGGGQVSFTVNRTAQYGYIVGKVFANDSDDGENGRVTYTLIQPSSLFSITQDGEIKVNASLHPYTGRINIQVLASDNPPIASQKRQAILQVTVDVKNVDTGSPVISNLDANITIQENIDIGSVVFEVEANDPDSQALIYTIIPSSETFIIDSESGVIRTNSSIDREENSTYVLTIRVMEQSLSSTGVLYISISDVNDNNPRFEKPLIVLNISEELQPGIIQSPQNPIQATDADEGSNSILKYSLLTAQGAIVPFSINDTTGMISTTSRIDREQRDTYDLYMMAMDTSDEPRSSNTQVKINVVDINDNAPIFKRTNISLSFPEESYPGCFYDAKAEDSDDGVNKEVNYVIQGGDRQLIEVKSNGSLCVINNQSLPLGNLNLVIIAYNPVPFQECSTCANSTLYMSIEVIDINNQKPVFNQTSYNFNLDEGLTHNDQMRVFATDNDTTASYNGVLYSLINDARFYIDSVTGEIQFKTPPDFDPPNNQTRFQIQVGARDSGSTTAQTIVNVTININDINDNSPVFRKENYACSVLEAVSIGSKFGCMVTATDNDSKENKEIIYINTENVPFAVNATSGEIYVNGSLDYENGPRQYTMLIQAVDKGVQPKTGLTSVIISVNNTNDNPPEFLRSPFNFTLLEIAARGSLVGVISAKDNDRDPVTFYLPNNASHFAISDMGWLTTTNEMDLDTVGAVAQYDVTVKISDGKYENRSTVHINIESVNEYTPFFNGTYNGKVIENATQGTEIMKIYAEDDDSGVDGKITYSIESGNTGDVFHIDSQNGEITLNCNQCLDYNQKSDYELLVQASDNGRDRRVNFTTVDVQVIDVNDKPPRFSQTVYEADVKENINVNATILTLYATDDDTTNNLLQYSIVKPLDANISGLFRTEDSHIVVNRILDLDSLSSSVISFNVSVSDGVSSDYAMVRIEIRDVNEYAPVIVLDNYSISLPENTPVNTLVMNISATDRDFSNDGFTFWLTNEDDKFHINVSSGSLKVVNRFDRSMKDVYNITIHASDHGVPPLYSEKRISIVINDSNSAPVFNRSSYSFTIDENVDVGYIVGSVQARDIDYGSSGDIVYSIIGGNYGDIFSIGSASGNISTLKTVDFESRDVFDLKVQARDRSSIPKSTEVDVSIVVTDVLEAPQWPSSLPAVYFMKSKVCDQASQITAISSDARSSDNDATVVYSLLGTNVSFTVNNETGTLHPKPNINSGNYSLVLQACNSKSLDLCSNATLRVVVSEESRLIFCPTFVSVEVREDFPTNMTIIVLNTTSAHNNFTIVFSAQDTSSFMVDSQTGELKLLKSLDREKEDNYILGIKTVNPVNSQSATAQVTIRVIDVPDYPPFFRQGSYLATVSESSQVGDPVIFDGRPFFLTAVDKDLNPQLIYSVEGGGGHFDVNSSTGEITVATKLDRETNASFQFVVKVNDSYSTNTTTVEVTVTDVNDVSPTFNQSVFNISVSENSKVGTVLLTVIATDEDTLDDGQIRYKLLHNDARFEIGERTSEIVLRSNIDREEQDWFRFEVSAEDSVGHNGSCEVNIFVFDENDNRPAFMETVYRFNVTEGPESFNQSFTLMAKDKDIGENGRFQIRKQPGFDQYFNLSFHANEGVLTIIKELDREKVGLEVVNGRAVYNLSVVAEDYGTPRLTSSCAVEIYVSDINDNRPVFNVSKDYEGNVEEQSISGTSVVLVPSLSVTDADYGINGVEGLKYSIVETNVPFKAISSTGEIQVNVKNNDTLDRETVPFYEFQLLVTDNGGLNATAKVHVTILDKNDEAPQFSRYLYTFEVREDSQPSISVGNVSAYDKDNDGNSSVRYKLKTNGDGHFFIDGLTGEVKLAGGLDRETVDEYNMTVIAEDQSGFTGAALITVRVNDANDNPPVFSQQSYSFSIPENTKNVVIGSVFASDLDLGPNKNISYFVNDTEAIAVNVISGSITVLESFDRENASTFRFNVYAVDHGTQPEMSSSQVLISITDENDNSPRFCLDDLCENANYSATIVNNLPKGSYVYRVFAKDEDLGENGTVTFGIRGKAAGLFEIGQTNGLITTKGFDLNKLIDEGYVSSNETSNVTLSVMIQASDGGGRNASTFLDLSIQIPHVDVPTFNTTTYNFSVLENKSTNTSVGIVEAMVKNPTNLAFGYTIVGGSENDNQYFNVDYNSGNITTKHALDRERQDKYLLVIQVTDGRVPENTAYTQVYITVMDENDNKPVFNQEDYIVSVQENVYNRTLLTVQANDSDLDENGRITYRIVGGNDDGKFVLDRDSGRLNITRPLDREQESERILIIQAADDGLSFMASNVTVFINISDVNDNAPRISLPETTIHVKETNKQVVQILHVNATDPDQGLNGEVLYALVGGDQNVFQINALTGWLSTMRALLKQHQSSYKLEIMAYNLGIPSQNTTVDLTIKVVNGSAPRFQQRAFSVDVFVGMKMGSLVNVNLTAGTGVYSYRIANTNETNMFQINNTNGILTLAADLRELATYRLTIEATELADKQSRDITTVIITVRQQDVKFETTKYTANIEENLEGGVLVIDLNTTAEFSGIDIQYVIDGGDDMFWISSKNGCIYTNATFDREMKAEYILVVRVTSLIQSSRTKREVNSDTTRVVVHIDDVNDNPPVFKYTGPVMILSIPQSATRNYFITTLEAEDPDVSEPSSKKFSAIGGDDEVFSVNSSSGDVMSLVDVVDMDRDQFELDVSCTDTLSSLSSNLSLKIYVVPEDDRYIISGNITLPAFVAFKDTFLRNLSSILNMTIELDSIQPHASLVNGKRVISSDRSDIFIRALYGPDNKRQVPWKEIQQKVLSKRDDINDLFSQGMSYVTKETPVKTKIETATLGIAEMTLIGLACAIFLGSLIAIVVVLRSWKAAQTELKNLEALEMLNTLAASKLAKANGEASGTKSRRDPLVLEIQENCMVFGSEFSDHDTIALRDIVLCKTAMALESEIAGRSTNIDGATDNDIDAAPDSHTTALVNDQRTADPSSFDNPSYSLSNSEIIAATEEHSNDKDSGRSEPHDASTSEPKSNDRSNDYENSAQLKTVSFSIPEQTDNSEHPFYEEIAESTEDTSL